MKRRKLLFLLPMLLAAIGFLSCEKEQDNNNENKDPNENDTPDKVEIIVEPAGDISFEAEGGTVLLKIKPADIEWDVTKSDWINVAPDFQKGELQVTAGPCTDTEGRTGEITITGGAKPVTIKVSQKGIIPSLDIDKTSVHFSAEGGNEIIKISASHVEWTAKTEASAWLHIESDTQKQEIRITASSNAETITRTGEIVIEGAGVESKTIAVTQDAAVSVDFWNRSSAERLGYTGKVHSVSKHLDLINNNGSVELTDLEFDQSGNLVKFNRGDGMTVTVSYDENNKMKNIHAKSADYDFSFIMEYESHEKYIPIYEIFEYDLDVALPIDFRVWMPFFFKGLSSLSIRDEIEPGNNMDYHFNADGNNMTIDLYMEDGTPLYPQYYIIEYNGEYPAKLTSEGIETGIYETDPDTGMIIHQVMYSYYDIEYFRNLDKENSIRRAVFGEYDMSMEYNDYMDISTRESNHDDAIRSFSAEYKYDEAGNWLEATFKYKDNSTMPYSRTIAYW